MAKKGNVGKHVKANQILLLPHVSPCFPCFFCNRCPSTVWICHLVHEKHPQTCFPLWMILMMGYWLNFLSWIQPLLHFLVCLLEAALWKQVIIPADVTVFIDIWQLFSCRPASDCSRWQFSWIFNSWRSWWRFSDSCWIFWHSKLKLSRKNVLLVFTWPWWSRYWWCR